jgi:type IV pilus assembly protein PilV
MVAVVIICIGLLGIAKLQSLALSNSSMSRQRSLAAIEAASIASAMHSNRNYWAAFPANFSVSITGNPAVVTVVGDATLQGLTAADLAASPSTACIGANSAVAACPAAVNLAAFDLARWWGVSVSVQLPNPTATISCPPAPVGNSAPVSCTVQISWIEKSVAINAQEAAAQQATPLGITEEQPVFTLYVEP